MSMILLLHILAALSSLATATLTLIIPSRQKLQVTYGLVTTTLISGIYLVVSSHAPLVSSCTSGLIYLSAVATLIVAARRRLLN